MVTAVTKTHLVQWLPISAAGASRIGRWPAAEAEVEQRLREALEAQTDAEVVGLRTGDEDLSPSANNMASDRPAAGRAGGRHCDSVSWRRAREKVAAELMQAANTFRLSDEDSARALSKQRLA